MSTERERLALQLFEQALEVPEEQRAKWLSETCTDNEALVDEVRSLLAAHREADDFLESDVTRITPSFDLEHLPAVDLVPGKQLGDFVVERQIGAGGMGVVYRARQISLNRPVALKVLPPYLRYSESARTRFYREIEAAARLQHRHLVAVYTTGEEVGAAYYAMELIEGPALNDLIAELRITPLPELKSCQWQQSANTSAGDSTLEVAGDKTPLPTNPEPATDLSLLQSKGGYFRTVAQLMADVAEGLDYAHAQAVVHRDVKPSNLLFSPEGEIHLSDFGLARVGEHPGLTRTGEVLGTPFYMAPEQVSSELGEVDGRTDVYALGATLYELLTLRPPLVGQSRDQVTSQIMVEQPLPPRARNRQVPIDLNTICLKALEKQPSRRYQSAGQMADDLRNFAEGRPINTRPAGLASRGFRWLERYRATAAVALGMLALLAAASFFAYRSYQSEARWTDAKFDRVFETAQFAALEGDLERAAAAIDEAEQLGASTAQLNLLRGQLELNAGRYQQACDKLERAVAAMPDSVAAHALLATAYDSNEQNDQVAKVLKRLKQLKPVKLQDYLLLGQARLYRNEQEGIALLDEAVKLDKTNVVSRLVRGNALIHLAKVSGNPTHAEAALGDLRIATELLDANAFLLSRTLEARLIAASTDKLHGDADRYQENLNEAALLADKLSEFPENYRTHRWRAFYFDFVGNDAEALQSWRAMKNTRIAYYVIALFRLGKFDEALQLCDERLQRYPGARFTEYFRALLLSTQTDDCNKVLAAFVRDGKETLDRLNAHRFHFVIYCLAGQLEKANRYSRQLRDTAREFGTHGWQAQLLNYTCGDLDDQTLLEQAAQSRLALIEAHFLVGMSQLAQGNRTAASEHFKASAEFNAVTMLEGPLSRAFLAQLERDPRWPPWIE